MARLCECGCGKETTLAKSTSTKWGTVKGMPLRFLQGHGSHFSRRGKTHCARGHEYTAENTRVKTDGARTCRTCHSISRHRNRTKTWCRNAYFVDKYKTDKGCARCTMHDPRCLDFHHLGDKTENVSIASNQGWSLEHLQEEIEKCIVLCANCHRVEESDKKTKSALRFKRSYHESVPTDNMG